MKAPKKDKDGNYPIRLVLAVEGVETSDGRTIAPEALGHRTLPLSILGLTKTTGEGGHAGAEICGRLDTAERVAGPEVVRLSAGDGSGFPEGTFVWRGTGVLFADSPATDRFLQGGLRGNSVDLTAAEAEMTPAAEDAELADPKPGEPRKMPRPPKVTFTKATIAATTLCPVPAFEDAYIEADFGDGWKPVSEAVEQKDDAVVASLVAAGQQLPSFRAPSLGDFCAPCEGGDTDEPQGGVVVAAAPPAPESAPAADWFTDPQLTRLTRLTVMDSGEIVGHIAGWKTCHTSYQDRCVKPPRSRTDYAVFLGGSIRAQANGNPKRMGVGQLTVGGGHADRRLGLQAAVEHYDNVGTAVADIACGEDRFGIWVHGAMRPGVTADQLRALEGSKPSGDWRRFEGFPELMAVHCVNVAGFPVMAAYHDADGYQSLVAAGALEEGVSVAFADDEDPPTPSGAVMLDYDVLAERIAARLRASGQDVRFVRPDYEGEDAAAAGLADGDKASQKCGAAGTGDCDSDATRIVLPPGGKAPILACDSHLDAAKSKAGPGAVTKTLADEGGCMVCSGVATHTVTPDAPEASTRRACDVHLEAIRRAAQGLATDRGPAIVVELAPPQKPASVWHDPHGGQKCSRWASQHDDGKQPPAVACREEGGSHLGACAAHKREMTEGQEMAGEMDDDGPGAMGAEWAAFELAARRQRVALAERRRAALSHSAADDDGEVDEGRLVLALADVALDAWLELADTTWAAFLDQLDDLDVADRDLLASGDFNWVEDVGGLPKLIRRVADHLIAKGMTESRAIATAVNVCKRYCANPSDGLNFPGTQRVTAATKAKGCAAVAQWESKKARARSDGK